MLRTAVSVFMSVFALSIAAVNFAYSAGQDEKLFKRMEGRWSGPGEIVAGKFKGTKFTCTLDGVMPADKVGMNLDGNCRVGVFNQEMSANIVRAGRSYRGAFLDGAKGKGLDVVSGHVGSDRVVLSLKREQLNGAMLARMTGKDGMNVTISVKVGDRMVPVIGMRMKRIDRQKVGSID